ncbi:hypothetical protein OAN61_00155 [bacterium]|nr:hypothetical protein [bacterium]
MLQALSSAPHLRSNDDQVTHDELMKMHKHDKKERKKGMEVAGFKEMFGDILAEHSKVPISF